MPKTALEKVTKDAEEFALEKVQENQHLSDLTDVHRAFGAIGGMRLVSRFIGVSTIKLLQQIRDEEKYKSFGYARFDEFLEKDPLPQQYAGISYRTFNSLENQLQSEGEEIYELLNNLRVPISTRRQLFQSSEQVNIAIDGDTLFIGEEKTSLEDTPKIKELIKELSLQVKNIGEKKQKAESKIEELSDQLKIGANEYHELQRAMDAQSEGTPYEKALKNAVGALINLTAEAKNLKLLVSQDRGRSDVEALWKQMLLFRSAMYQDDFAFVEDAKAVEVKGISKRAMQVVAQNDDFGDEDE